MYSNLYSGYKPARSKGRVRHPSVDDVKILENLPLGSWRSDDPLTFDNGDNLNCTSKRATTGGTLVVGDKLAHYSVPYQAPIMARLLFVALLSLNAYISAAHQPAVPRLPFCISRGGSDAESVSSIPSGGASSYASQLEAVKASVLEAAAESVSSTIQLDLLLSLLQ